MAIQDEINAKSTAALTAGEIDRVREILDFDATADTAYDNDLIVRIAALSGVKNQRLKAYIDDWDAVPAEPVEVRGGPQARYYATSKHEEKVRNKTRLLLGYVETDKSGSAGIKFLRYGSASSYCDDGESVN